MPLRFSFSKSSHCGTPLLTRYQIGVPATQEDLFPLYLFDYQLSQKTGGTVFPKGRMCVSLSAFPEAEYRNPMFFFHDVDHAVPVGNCVYQKRIYLNNSDPLLEIILSFLVGKADIPNLYIV